MSVQTSSTFVDSVVSCLCHPLFDLRPTQKIEIRHTNFHFSSKSVTSKSRKVEVFDLTFVCKSRNSEVLTSTFRVKLLGRKVEKGKFFDMTIVNEISTFRSSI